MKLNDALNLLPDSKGCVVILSGGMDSTIAMRIAVEKYGSANVSALTFFYGQKQAVEIDMARVSTSMLGVEHKVIDISFLGDISKGFSANVDPDIVMPTAEDVVGDFTPKTYVPNRNMILLSIAAAYAETRGVETIITGVQVHDAYGYWDTTQNFVDKMNGVFSENRGCQLKLIAPFCFLSKTEELAILNELDGNLDLLYNTITCYNPNELGQSCGVCPSCEERINAFKQIGQKDTVSYSTNILWD